ncbi:MAG TPA: glycyl-radical enzyme activating protein [Myxococcota bacterium]|nr:glycyl-radical enzyme activating protein [Myxococcota bacterium]HRY94379.1 glycyl-radical enzyme activating protein [Myxococcota bacterium]HSA20007.1 glycyl-radical enzyme activating protein [Myxococcota bacterium]
MRAAERQALLADVRENSLDDGPGIRTTVFVKGCGLRCAWCHNPEAREARPELQLRPERCLGCGACRRACPRGERRAEPGPGCRACGACALACPAAARRVVGAPLEVEALAERLLLDAPFFRRSGGGVTLSGGEPGLVPRPLGRLAARLRAQGVHVLLETAGHFPWAPFAEHLLPHLDAIFFDLKLADPREHLRLIGVGPELILANLDRLLAAGAPALAVRTPLVPGLTDGEANLRGLAGLLRARGLTRLRLVPYNPLVREKRRALGLAGDELPAGFQAPAELDRCRAIVRAEGLALEDERELECLP